ncbi:MAG TPA: hypothetical protein VM366_12410, partial [Anaerolineae bacterium]|nr:hypothetical protein [Anaerolineae bacterium]
MEGTSLRCPGRKDQAGRQAILECTRGLGGRGPPKGSVFGAQAYLWYALPSAAVEEEDQPHAA